jgi:cytochrome c oxidase assembly factor 5
MPSCDEIRTELIECVQKSPCMSEHRYTMQQCMEKDNLPLITEECMAIKKSFGDCKRSLVSF